MPDAEDCKHYKILIVQIVIPLPLFTPPPISMQLVFVNKFTHFSISLSSNEDRPFSIISL